MWPPLPASASQTPYSQREAEAGSPAKFATATPSNNVIVLIRQRNRLHGGVGAIPECCEAFQEMRLPIGVIPAFADF
jgi:hypothetical protein